MSETRVLRLCSSALIAAGLALGALAVLGPLRDVDGSGWSLPLVGAGVAGLVAVRPRRKDAAPTRGSGPRHLEDVGHHPDAP